MRNGALMNVARYSACAMLFCTVLPLLAWAAEPVLLAWNLHPGDRFYIEDKTTVRQTIKTNEIESRYDLNLRKILRLTVVKKNPDQSLVFEEKIETVNVETAGKAAGDILKQFEGTQFLVAVTARGRIVGVDGFEAFIKRISRDAKADARWIKAFVTQDAVTSPLERLLAYLPDSAVRQGDRWEAKTSASLGPVGKVMLVTSCSLVEFKQATREARIAMESQADFLPADKRPGGQIHSDRGFFRLVESKGEMLFSAASGRMLGWDMHQVLDGKLPAGREGKTKFVEFHHEQTQKGRIISFRQPFQK
jgi:hypothetical protein